MQIWDVNLDNIVVSKLIERKTKSKYLIGTKFYKAIRPLVLILPKMTGYVKTFKVREGEHKMSFCIDNENLLEKYKAICTNIEDLKIVELN